MKKYTMLDNQTYRRTDALAITLGLATLVIGMSVVGYILLHPVLVP
jgi:hypothetical protein